MNRALARKLADSVLYEGYMLYPYRPSAIKNRQRWSFGILYPPGYAEVIRGTERSQMHSECLLEGKADAPIQIELRFLHLALKQIFHRMNDGLEAVPPVAVGGHLAESRDEAKERSVTFEVSLGAKDRRFEFTFAGSNKQEPLRDSAGEVLGMTQYTQQELRGVISASLQTVGGAWRLAIDVENQTLLAEDPEDRNAALPSSLLSAQMILTAEGANFVSLLDPPEGLREAAARCRNVGNFPVLLGSVGEREMLLCSPILLYDYPQVARESAGDFYDGTEMDEILTLRVMTLTDEEKSQMRAADEPVRHLLERTEATAREQLMRTHGTIRELRQITE